MGKLCFFVLLAALALGLFAEENQANDLNLSMEASLGLLSGRGEELVYRDKDTDDKLSQLLWDFKPLVYAGLGIDFSWRKPENKWGVFTDALFKFGIPGGSGVMEDRDWMALNYPDFLTHYSVHDNRTEKAVLIDADIGASFQIFENFLLKTYISYSFMYFSWTANGGSLLYPNWDIDGNGTIDGEHGYLRPIDVGTYKQIWNIVSPAVSFYGAFNRYFDIEIAFKASPFILCDTQDNHILRSLLITSTLRGGLFLEPRLLFSFTPQDFFTLSLSVTYRNISGTRGESKYDEAGKIPVTGRNIGGTGYSAFDAGIIAVLRLF